MASKASNLSNRQEKSVKSVFTTQSARKQAEQNEFEKIAQQKRNYLRASKSICGKSVLEPLQKPANN